MVHGYSQIYCYSSIAKAQGDRPPVHSEKTDAGTRTATVTVTYNDGTGTHTGVITVTQNGTGAYYDLSFTRIVIYL